MFNQGVKRVQDMLRENGNREAVFDISKLTVFCVDVFSNTVSDYERTTQKSSEKILDEIRKNSKITVIELSSALGISSRAIEKSIRQLRESGVIKRTGGKKNGYWEIIKK